jgi:hypothetical protein
LAADRAASCAFSNVAIPSGVSRPPTVRHPALRACPGLLAGLSPAATGVFGASCAVGEADGLAGLGWGDAAAAL